MDSLGHSSLPPISLGGQDDEEATTGVRSLHSLTNNRVKKRIAFREDVYIYHGHLTPRLSETYIYAGST
ncbi:hypothetical protein TNCV_2327091 [Trichonephila clavipes]|nr:hypothetical protein TNCV_2327091 [Trichonephila clavipes]